MNGKVVIITAMSFFQNFRKISFVFASAAFIFVFFTACAAISPVRHTKTKGTLSVHFIDVGLGDSIFIDMPSGENMLVDVGSQSAGPRVAAYLKSIDVRKIDRLILTHPHDDHVGGIFSVYPEFRILSFFDNGFSDFRYPLFRNYTALVRKSLSQYHILQAGEAFQSHSVTINVLNPMLPPTGNLNSDSIVLRLIYGDISILFTADIGQEIEKILLDHGTDLSSQILKVSHHGDNDASSREFLQRVGPEAAIISVSAVNRYGRPHQEVVSRIEDIGAQIYRTDRNGNIVLRTDGTTYSITTGH
jgi:competence protein ComEC